MRNKIGPKTLPWGTPLTRGKTEEKQEPIHCHCKNRSIQSIWIADHYTINHVHIPLFIFKDTRVISKPYTLDRDPCVLVVIVVKYPPSLSIKRKVSLSFRKQWLLLIN